MKTALHLLFLVSSTVILAPVTSAGKLRGGGSSSGSTGESGPLVETVPAAVEDENPPVLIPLVQEEEHDQEEHDDDEEHDDNLEIPSHWDLLQQVEEPVDGMPSSSPIPHQIASRGDLDILQDIVTKEPDWILARDIHGWTLLHEAARSGNVQVCQYLLDMGADINAETNRGSTALYEAEHHHGASSPIVQFLTSRGATHKAPRSMHEEEDDDEEEDESLDVESMSVQQLVLARIPHILAAEGRLDELRFLAETKGEALLTASDNHGWTPLHEAARYEQLDIIQYLIEERHLDVDPVTPDGSTPMYYAQRFHGNNSKVEQLFQSYGAHIHGPLHGFVDSFLN